MHGIRLLVTLALSAATSAGLAAQGVTTFNVNVPNRTAPLLPLSVIKITVTVSADQPVAFNITNPHGFTRRFPAAGTMSPGSPGMSVDFCDDTNCVPPSGATGVDRGTVLVPSGSLPTGDPARRRYVFTIQTRSDYNTGAFCANTMSPPESWTVALASPPAALRITSTCVESFDRNSPGNICLLDRRTPLNEPRATVSGLPEPDAFCGDDRPAVDVTLVLDRSGSMNSSTLGGAPRPKMQALRSAVLDFVSTWTALRSAEAGPAKDDRIGLVFFNNVARWHGTVGVPAWSSLGAGPQPFATFAPLITQDRLDAVNATSMTTIGDGLFEAATNFGSSDRRKAILVMSDGMQNFGRMVAVDQPGTPSTVLTHPRNNPSALTPLPNQSGFSIYSVTVGTSTAVSADIKEDIARATGGFYINTEDNAEMLRPFFLEMLQNFLRFNTWETVRLATGTLGTQPYTVRFNVTSTTDRLFVNLTTPGQAGMMLSLTPPGGGNPHTASGNGRVQLTVDGRRAPLAPGEWVLQAALSQGALAARSGNIPIGLVVLADDPLLRSQLWVEPADYAPGDDIIIRARLTARGEPITPIGQGGRVAALVVRPGQSLGEILASAAGPVRTADGPPPGQVAQGDTATGADAALQALLQQNPDALRRIGQEIVLRDDGSGPDAQAGDGVYSARFRASEPGHYHFVFLVEGTAPDMGRFSRQQSRTVHVRSVPAPARTSITSTTVQGAQGNVLVLRMEPRTATGSRMGPGWANYFWFTGGGQTVKATDAGNGTYEARMPYTGAQPPQVQVHFVRTSTIIDASVQPDQLPVRLGGGTLIVPDAVAHGDPGAGGGCGSLPIPIGIVIGASAIGVMGRRRLRP